MIYGRNIYKEKEDRRITRGSLYHIINNTKTNNQ